MASLRSEPHTHAVAETDRMGRLTHETCACGAYRITWPDGRVDDWHACPACVR
jgi:hypothetical protein